MMEAPPISPQGTVLPSPQGDSLTTIPKYISSTTKNQQPKTNNHSYICFHHTPRLDRHSFSRAQLRSRVTMLTSCEYELSSVASPRRGGRLNWRRQAPSMPRSSTTSSLMSWAPSVLHPTSELASGEQVVVENNSLALSLPSPGSQEKLDQVEDRGEVLHLGERSCHLSALRGGQQES